MWLIRRITSGLPSRIFLALPFMLILLIHKTTEPLNSNFNAHPSLAFTDHTDYPVYNPNCAKLSGNVDNPIYINYTSRVVSFPITSSADAARFPSPSKYHFAVNTAPKSYLARREIRRSWKRTLDENTLSGKYPCSGSLRFYVGQTDDKRVARRLHQELKQHDDMVFIEFCDKYETLPLKTYNIMARIAATVPKTVEWVVKIDDDVLPNFALFFDCFPTYNHKDFGIYGWVTIDNVVHDTWDKYRVVKNRYNGTVYPGFTHGPSYAVRAEVLPKLLHTAEATPMLNLEDVWFTGIVAEAAGVKRFDIRSFVMAGRSTVDLTKNLHNTNKAGFFYHNVGPRMMKKFWTRMGTSSVYVKNHNSYGQRLQPEIFTVYHIFLRPCFGQLTAMVHTKDVASKTPNTSQELRHHRRPKLGSLRH